MNPEDRPWTKLRVLRAYVAWRDLQRHAEDVFEFWRTLSNRDDITFDELRPPSWIGTNWPGSKAIIRTIETGSWYTSEEPQELPIEYLWTTEWRAEMERQRAEWDASAAAREQERRDKVEYERLKAKFAQEAAP